MKSVFYVAGLGLAFWLGWVLKPVQTTAATTSPSLQQEQPAAPIHQTDNTQVTAVESPSTAQVTMGDELAESAVSESRYSSSDLAEFADKMAEGGEQSRQHLQERERFEQEWDQSSLDLGLVNQLQDFLYLHQYGELIQLHDIRCDSDRCQLTGQMAGEHDKWEQLVKAMQSTDWWSFTGTSNSSTTRDGVTYFVLFLRRE